MALAAVYGLPAPAKINWFLHVIGRRPDGYHELQTVFQFIDWADDLDLLLRRDGLIRRIGADHLPAEDLTVRAARLLQQAAGVTLGVDIHLRKRVPALAGLGGGSSDAATVLIGLNHLWGLHWSRQRLQTLALALGADVPVFVFGRNAWAQGVGEQLQAIELPALRWAVVHPGRGLSTAAVFAGVDLTNLRPVQTMGGFAEWLDALRRELQEGQTEGQTASAAEACAQRQEMWGSNDLQPVAESLEPAVAQALQGLAAHTRFAPRMSGSGTAVFGLLDARGEPPACPAGWSVRVCQGLPEHPLRGWLGA